MLLDVTPLRQNRDFRFLYLGQIISFVGSMVTYVAVPYQVYQLTRSSFLVGLLGAAQLVPLLVFGLFGGSYADALDRRRMMIVSELILAAGSLGLMANSLLAKPSVALIFVVSSLMSGVNGFHRPAFDALTQSLVTPAELTAVSALGTLRFSVGAILGPAFGGVVLARGGAATAYLFDAVTFLASIVCLLGVRRFAGKTESKAAGLEGIREGLRYATSRPELVGTYVVDMVAMTFAFPTALFPAMGEAWGGATAVGWLYAGMSLGSLVVTLLSGWTGGVRRHGAAVVLSAAGWGAAVIALAFAKSLWVAVACLALAGAADTVSGIFRMTIWNATIPNELRGRLSGIEMISYTSGPLLGNARAGWMAQAFSNGISIGVGGAVCLAGVLSCIWLLPGFWRYRSDGSRRESGAQM